MIVVHNSETGETLTLPPNQRLDMTVIPEAFEELKKRMQGTFTKVQLNLDWDDRDV